jgi:hypothetical protein
MRTPKAAGYKDLQDLRGLPRSLILSHLQKQAMPDSPRPKSSDNRPSKFPLIRAFTPGRFWDFVREYLRNRLGPRHAFRTYSGDDLGIYPLEGDEEGIRIALCGDWGTGTDEAHDVAQRIKESEPHYTIHLGDIYYVGDGPEVRSNFLGEPNKDTDYEPCLWPSGSKGAFALLGNHEMYARGNAYFELMLPKLGLMGAQRKEQKASFFCLENEFWRIIALDTGYDSVGWPIVEVIFPPACGLTGDQLRWIRNELKLRDDGRGIILLSHHQYYSRFDTWYPTAARQLTEFLKRPVIWFWGHEHRMAAYAEFGVQGGVQAFGRCIGHGGMPVELPSGEPLHPKCPLEFIDKRPYKNDENLTLGMNGFARIVLKGPTLGAEYVDLHGGVVFSESWQIEDGQLTRLWRRP